MRYRTQFRVLLQLLGVYFVVHGIATALAKIADRDAIINLLYGAHKLNSFGGLFASGMFELVAGLCLFFGCRWIVNLAMPSNRPCCQECGYDLSKTTANRCPECGTPRSNEG